MSLLLHGSGSTTTNSYSCPMFLHGIILMMHTHAPHGHTAMAAAAASGTDSCPAEESDERDDPGAAPYGNFINYYTFNPPENRLSLIPTTLLQDLGYHSHHQPTLILDVGCNSGELSVALHQHLKKNASNPEGGEDEAGEKPADTLPSLHILGFDLDERLVRRAQENSPLPEAAVSFVQLDITANDSQSRLLAYAERHGRPRFHVCLCLAVTMWVHLNHGDGALLDMLSRLAAVSDHLLLEAQPWKCYRAAARRQRRAAGGDGDGARLEHHFKTLKLRGDMAEHAREHLESRCGMELAQSFGSTAWDRRLLLFKRK